MDLKQLQYLLTLAEHRNFTKASKALYISQPSLSSYVAKVEDDLGVALFDRSTNPLTITYAGEIYIKGAEEILDAYRRLENRLSDISAHKIGRIRVALSNDRASYMIPLILPKYQQLHPDVSVQITPVSSAQIPELFLDNQIDLAILPSGSWSKQTLIRSDLYSEELVLVADRNLIREEYLMEGVRNAVDIYHLGDIPLITLEPQHSIRSFVDHLFSSNGLRPNIIMETSSLTSAYRLATAGLGAATIIPRMTLELIRGTQDTPVYSLGSGGTTWKIVAIQRKDREAGQIEKDFITLSRQIFLSHSPAQPEIPMQPENF